MKKTALFMGTLAVLATSTFAYQAMAATEDVDATLNTRQALSLTKNNDMDFGDVDYEATHTGTIRLGTDGNVALNAATGLTIPTGSTGNAADIDVSGDNASTIEISCETGGTLADSSSNTLTLQATEVAIDTGVAFGSGSACAGVGTTSTTVDLSANNNPTILIGGEVDLSSNAIATTDTYTSTNAGGDPVTVSVTYQ